MTAATGRDEDQLWHGGSLAADALQAWADGSLLRARIAASCGRARFKGLPQLEVGHTIELSGLGDRFNGKVLVTGIRHEFTDNNWVTDAQFGLPRKTLAETFTISELPAAGLVPAVSGLQLGIVTQLADDPAGESRIRVKIPVAGFSEQGVWARVATLDAGAGRGTLFRPEVDDEVAVGFFHDDPAQPVVLGMLHSSAKEPPEEASEDNHRKVYVSRSGLTLAFDDEESVLTMSTPGENLITLSDADGGITLEDENGNSIMLTADGIVLKSASDIAFQADGDIKLEGTNIELKASAELKAEASAAAELKSSGTLTMQGSLVQIN
jgi:Rhs element Vgr protein